MTKIVFRIIFVAVLLACVPPVRADWELPTNGTDAGGVIPWTNLPNAYDAGSSPPIGNYSSTYASNGNSRNNSFGNWAVFTFAAAYCDSIGVYADSGAPGVDYVQIEVYDTGSSSWVTVCGSTPLTGTFPANGVLPNDTWTVVSFTPYRTINQIRFRYHYTTRNYNYWLWNIAYHEIPVTPSLPTIETLSANIDLNSVTLQGLIDDDGGRLCSASFQWGTTAAYGNTASVVPSSTRYSTGMICGAFLSGLTTGQTYHYRVVVTNDAGTEYGNDMTFVPAAPGPGWWVGPTGDLADPSPPTGAQQWQNRVSAYDDDDQTFSTLLFNIGDTSPTTYLYLTHAVALTCDKIRVKASTSANISAMQIDVYNSTTSSWGTVFNSGTYPDQQWLEVSFTPRPVTQVRIRFSITGSVGFVINVANVDLHVVWAERAYGFVDGAFGWSSR